jgi:hypothetical protein
MPNPQPQQAFNWATLLQLWTLLQQLFAGQGKQQMTQAKAGDKAHAATVGCCCTCIDHALAIVADCCQQLEDGGCPCPPVPPDVEAKLKALAGQP